MKLRLLVFCTFVIALAATEPTFAQDYEQIQKAIQQQQEKTRTELDQINDLINQYEHRLNTAKQKYEEIYQQYENLKRLIALRKQKISSLEKERDQINQKISATQEKITQQEDKLEELIDDYKKTLRYLYKNGRTSQLALILSSSSINQMMVRNYYLKKFETYRQKQADEITQTKKDLEDSKEQLNAAAEENKKVLAEIEVEKKKLEEKAEQQETNVKLLRQDKEQIQQKVTESRQQKEALNSTLSQLIDREKKVREDERERRRRQQLAENDNNTETSISNTTPNAGDEEATGASSANTNYVGTVGYLSDAELSKIESSFASEKGELPWPVNSSTISEHFGRRRNPVYGTVTPNLGIEIVTNPKQDVHVVHSGYVFEVQPITGYGDVVFVSHGKYITAYGNLSQVLVRKNTILKEGDLVGYAGDSNSARGASVFFMLRAGSQNQDPENWLKDK